MDKSLALSLFEIYCEHDMNDDEESAGYVKNSLRDGKYHVEVDEVEGIYRLRHIVRAEGVNILVAEKEVFGETIVKHKEWMI